MQASIYNAAENHSSHKLPISICLIAKNEENHVKNCLEPLQKLGFEIIVVDTGSSDSTVELASAYTDKVFHFTWCDDFSAARNYAVSKASNPYILTVDFDEYLMDCDLAKLASLISSTCIGMITLHNPQADDNDNILVEHVARFFHRDNFQYTGRVHEQLTPRNNQQVVYSTLPLTFKHVGYSNAKELQQKATRNLQLLLSDLEQNGSNPYTCFQIGQSYRILKDYENALNYYDLGLSFEVDPNLEYVQTMVESYGYCLLELKRIEQALQLQNIYIEFSKRADFVFLMGLIYMNAGMFQAAIDEFKKATTISNYATLGTNSYLAWYNAGIIYDVMGNKQEALECYSKCGTYSKAVERVRLLSTNQ